MVTFESVLAGEVANGTATVDGSRPVEDLVAAALDAGWRLFHLDGAEIDSKDALLDAVANAVGFPDWAGRNWDALADLLTDGDILDPAGSGPAGYVVVHDRPDVLEVADARAAAIAADILADAAAHWSSRATPFVTLHRETPAL